jgi:hypothetical protein
MGVDGHPSHAVFAGERHPSCIDDDGPQLSFLHYREGFGGCDPVAVHRAKDTTRAGWRAPSHKAGKVRSHDKLPYHRRVPRGVGIIAEGVASYHQGTLARSSVASATPFGVNHQLPPGRGRPSTSLTLNGRFRQAITGEHQSLPLRYQGFSRLYKSAHLVEP